ncbi:hypothetical protein HZA99_02970 [Candidatus Woesearchaeota archaeon]|nr:hypothetical protein [Candidatus Woesearchaeota archaeon]
MKKTVLAFVAILSLALLLAGCGQTTSKPTQTIGTPASQEQTTQTAPASETTTVPAKKTASPQATPTETTTTETTASGNVADTSSVSTIAVAGCSDTDSGKDYSVKGSLVDARGVTDVDRCSSNENYPGRLYESYCKEDGNHGRETYDCPSGKCSDGACVAAESTQ